jgi:hypothetical protein
MKTLRATSQAIVISSRAPPVNPDQLKSPQRPQGADWLSWFLHLFLGLPIGAVAGFLIEGQATGRSWGGEKQSLYSIIGGALVCGAITSYRGQRAWFHPLSLPPNDPSHSTASRVCSFIIGSAGLGVFFWPVAQRINLSSFSFNPEFDLPLLIVLALLIGGLVFLLRRGHSYREEQPLWFWIHVAMISLSAIYIVVEIFG